MKVQFATTSHSKQKNKKKIQG